MYVMRGMGVTADQAVQLGASAATPVVGGILASSAASAAAATGTAATILGMAPALAIPLVGAAIAGIAIGIQLLLHSGCGQSCIITSKWANQAQDLLDQNLKAYMALPKPRSQSAQAAALENFDKVWNYLVQECSTVSGDAGHNCIADRKAGACKWQANGECWNWFIGFRDPIANDVDVVSDLEAASSSASGVASQLLSSVTGGTSGSSLLPLGLAAAAIAAVFVLSR